MVAKNFLAGSAWVPGVIMQQLGPLTYLVEVEGGTMWKHHMDHVKEYLHRCSTSENGEQGERSLTTMREEVVRPKCEVSSPEEHSSSIPVSEPAEP